jgi:hypothetical protein
MQANTNNNNVPLQFVGPTREETIQLQKKFRNKNDLYKYLTQVLVSKLITPGSLNFVTIS